ncbi:ABC transporter sub-family G-like protein 17 [Sarcoptes scabiei]|uniref:ABC transporter sub-family G-like protein 17 n=1 Tax=Sarcoptes scabiei TaxID=52283 RepID=A0A132AF28_SARSC|nr:ABC transporter sub-family G-like protein 17 [Sarcoptes scabiei]
MTGQLRDLDRFLWYLLVTTLTASIAQSQGFLVGALFMSDASTAVFLGPITTVPIMLFGGFFVRIKFIPNYLKIFGHLSYLRYSFELMLMIIYGMDRCHLDPEMLNLNQTEPEWKGMANMLLGEGSDKFVDEFAKSLGGVYNAKSGKKYRSTILNQYDIEEENFIPYLIILILFYLIFQSITYATIVKKIGKRD